MMISLDGRNAMDGQEECNCDEPVAGASAGAAAAGVGSTRSCRKLHAAAPSPPAPPLPRHPPHAVVAARVLYRGAEPGALWLFSGLTGGQSERVSEGKVLP